MSVPSRRLGLRRLVEFAVLIAIGTFLMIEKKAVTGNKAERKSWLLYAILSAVFASLTSILGKVGIDDICQKVFISHIGSPCQGTVCPLLLIILYNTLFCVFLQVRSCTEHGGNPLNKGFPRSGEAFSGKWMKKDTKQS